MLCNTDVGSSRDLPQNICQLKHFKIIKGKNVNVNKSMSENYHRQYVLTNLKHKCNIILILILFVITFICKWLDCHVFSDTAIL